MTLLRFDVLAMDFLVTRDELRCSRRMTMGRTRCQSLWKNEWDASERVEAVRVQDSSHGTSREGTALLPW